MGLRAGSCLAKQARLQPVGEQFAIGQAGEVVAHRILQQAFLGGLLLGDVGDRTDAAHHLAVRADDRARLEVEPHIMAVGGADAEFLADAAAALIDHRVERGAEAVAVEQCTSSSQPLAAHRAHPAPRRATGSASGLT